MRTALMLLTTVLIMPAAQAGTMRLDPHVVRSDAADGLQKCGLYLQVGGIAGIDASTALIYGALNGDGPDGMLYLGAIVLRTEDGGAAWRQTLGPRRPEMDVTDVNDLTCGGTRCFALCCWGAEALGEIALFTSASGGRRWRCLLRFDAPHYACNLLSLRVEDVRRLRVVLDCPGEIDAAFGAEDSVLYELATTKGGATWTSTISAAPPTREGDEADSTWLEQRMSMCADGTTWRIDDLSESISRRGEGQDWEQVLVIPGRFDLDADGTVRPCED